MSFDWDAPVYEDIDREARADWTRERPTEAPSNDDEWPFDPAFDPKERRQRLGIPEPVIPDFSEDAP